MVGGSLGRRSWIRQIAKPSQWHDPVGFCIYCETTGSPENPISDEHVIPEGFGAQIVVRQASCRDCAREIGKYEEDCQRIMFPHVRAAFNLYGKRRKATRPTHFTVSGDDGTKHRVRTEEYPLLIVWPKMPLTGFAMQRTELTPFPDLNDPRNYWFWQSSDAPAMFQQISHAKRLRQVSLTFTIPISQFYKLLAKIAYAYAVGFFGYGGFRPFVKHIVRLSRYEITPDATHFIGQAPDEVRQEITARGVPTEAYRLALYKRPRADLPGWIVCAYVQFFSHILEAPIYEVIVGQNP